MALRFGDDAPCHWVCGQCGLECIEPQPDDQTLAKIYDASYFAHYQNTVDPQIVRAMKRATYKRQLRKLVAQESNGGPRRLLDCGAATGYLCELAQELGWNPFAIEISEFGAESCAKLLGSERVYRGEVEAAKFPANAEGRFEAITMFDFIEHVRNPLRVLEWARQRLVPGGSLLLTTPRTESISWRLMGRQWFHYTSREHLWFFSPESMKRLLRQSGLSSVRVWPLPKAVTVGYALAHYGRETSHSKIFSPPSRFLNAVLGKGVKRQRMWFYLGEMGVLAHG
jgi:2-polyprenyl-3-methyl-5-hydroxy-6-metoxy-1,4-benzoquinol methylase